MLESENRGGWTPTGALALTLAGALALVGCAGKPDSLAARPERPHASRTLSVADFRTEPAAPPAAVVGSAAVGAQAQAAASALPGAESGGRAAATAVEAPPTAQAPPGAETAPAAETPIEPPAFVSHAGLVGQVNGRPIYVAEFFAPIENQLRIWGRDMTRLEFTAKAYTFIQEQLAELITRELVYSEAEASLTENERVGLRYFLQQLEADVTRTRGRVAQEQVLREEQGLGVDEVIELERRKQLVKYKIQAEIRKRVVVSWRDVERYYRDHYAEFNPPASIQVRILAVKASDAAKRAEIERSLAEGYLFSALAEEHSAILASRGGLLDPMPLTQGLESTAITRWPEVDALARTLREGEFGGPVVNGDLAIWVYVENFEDGTGRSLYDLQHEIQERLANERFAAEQKKYLADLFARGNMDDFNNMTYLLLDIAIQRWARPE